MLSSHLSLKVVFGLFLLIFNARLDGLLFHINLTALSAFLHYRYRHHIFCHLNKISGYLAYYYLKLLTTPSNV